MVYGLAIPVLLFLILISLGLAVLTWIGEWTAASKAGQFGLLACIPFVQLFIFSIMAGKPPWWGLLLLVPVINLVLIIIVMHGISKRFGCGIGTTLGLIFFPFIFWPILGLGGATYRPI